MPNLRKYTTLTPEGRKEFAKTVGKMYGVPNPQKKGYKEIECTVCKKVIHRFRRSAYPRGHVPKEKIMDAIRHHYQKKHPKKFAKFAEKAVKTKRKKGIINKKGSKKPKKPKGKGWKWNSKAKHWVRRKKKGRGFEFA